MLLGPPQKVTGILHKGRHFVTVSRENRLAYVYLFNLLPRLRLLGGVHKRKIDSNMTLREASKIPARGGIRYRLLELLRLIFETCAL